MQVSSKQGFVLSPQVSNYQFYSVKNESHVAILFAGPDVVMIITTNIAPLPLPPWLMWKCSETALRDYDNFALERHVGF